MEVKEFTKQHELLHWLLMDGGITPKAQPLDVLINKIFKGFFRDLFEEWSLNAPINEKTGHPYAPSCQLLAQWVVQAWDRISEDLVRKAWAVCGYRPVEDLEGEATSDAVVEYSQQELGTIVERIMGDDARMAWIDEANEREPPLPEDSDDERELGWDWTEGWESSDEDDMSVLFDKDSDESEMSESE